MTIQAVRDYNLMLETEPGLLEESRVYLLERFNQVRLVFGGRMLSPYLRPHFLTPVQWQQVTRACEAVWSAIAKVAAVAHNDPVMLDQLGLTAAERELAAVDPGYDEVSVTSRLDSFLAGYKYRFVELNAECPAGIAYGDVASEIFLDMPAMRLFRRRHNVEPLYCRHLMLDALLGVFAKVRGKGKIPNIGIIDYSDVPTQREFELFKEFFDRNRYQTVIADPRAVELRDGRLFHRDFQIDIVYRRVLTTELLGKADECGDFIDAYRTGAAVFVNSFRTKYVHKKMLFGVLTDDRYQHHFKPDEAEAIRRYVPWTRRVEDRKSTAEGGEINLLEFIRRNRERLVLKPNDDYGGHGIYIGWESDEGAWEEAMRTALEGDYLVQERVTTGRELFPCLNETAGSVDMIEQLLDIDPLLFFGRVHGAFTRLSSTSLANVTSGAGMVPTMVVG